MLEGSWGHQGKSRLHDVIADRHKRLAQLQQSSKRNPHYQTLERDLIEFQEQQLFELFVVVSLQKKPSDISYVPQVIQQFPSKVGASRPGALGSVAVSLCARTSSPLVCVVVSVTLSGVPLPVGPNTRLCRHLTWGRRATKGEKGSLSECGFFLSFAVY